MATSFTTPNMGLVVPVPSQEVGPNWANDINASLAIIDAHDHASGSGVQITPAGININADLAYAGNSITGLKTLRFSPQSGPISAASPNLGCLYEAGTDLYYNDGAGNQIRITQSGSVAGSTGTITGLPSGTASAAYQSGSGSFVFQQATSTGANLDVASIAIRYPGSYPTPSGNFIQLQAPAALATGYNLTFPAALPVSANSLVTESTGGVLSYTTVDGSTITIAAGTMQVPTHGITATQIANNTITATQIANATLTGTQLADNINLPGTTTQSNGNNLVVSSNASSNLKIVRGFVGGGGAIISGEGFTVSKTGTGTYHITFSPNLSGTPVVSGSCGDGSSQVFATTAVTNSAFNALTFTSSSGNGVDASFAFVAIGQS